LICQGAATDRLTPPEGQGHERHSEKDACFHGIHLPWSA
jgi:hypothetical protein